MFLLGVLALNAETLQTGFASGTKNQVSSTLETKFTDYAINQISGTINESTFTVSVTLPTGTDLSALVPVFSLSTGASASIDGIAQVSTSIVNFSAGSKTYTIKNGENSQDWVVTVKTADGVNENAQLEAEVYPNPANEQLTIGGVENATVTVVNIIGHQIDRIRINDVTRTISTLAYPNGTYLVIIESNGKKAVKKVSVIH